jgi:hypothetical protein
VRDALEVDDAEYVDRNTADDSYVAAFITRFCSRWAILEG